jgi:hypothetical protein
MYWSHSNTKCPQIQARTSLAQMPRPKNDMDLRRRIFSEKELSWDQFMSDGRVDGRQAVFLFFYFFKGWEGLVG